MVSGAESVDRVFELDRSLMKRAKNWLDSFQLLADYVELWMRPAGVAV
jgi:hypothetical protein